MADKLEQIKELEDELKKTKYNKSTQHHIGLVKAKIARLREREQSRKKGKPGEGFSVRKSGDATVVLLGFPSVGKSTLLNKVCHTQSPVAAYAFTTLTVIPGTLEYKHAKIQILDVPGVVAGAAAGTGRGKEVLQVLRNADLILILLDALQPEHYSVLLKEIYDVNIRIDQVPPDVKITKTSRGGIRIGKTVPLSMMNETITAICKEFRINNAEVLIRTPITEDQLIDVIEGSKKYVDSILVINKIDLATPEQISSLRRQFPFAKFVSAEQEQGIEELKEAMFQKLQFVRIYLKEIGKKPDLDVPMIMMHGCTLRKICERLHKDFVAKFRFARIWGSSVKFAGMKVMKIDHALQDNDIVEIRLK